MRRRTQGKLADWVSAVWRAAEMAVTRVSVRRKEVARYTELRVEGDEVLRDIGETTILLRLQGERSAERLQARAVVGSPGREGRQAIEESAGHRRWIQRHSRESPKQIGGRQTSELVTSAE